MRAKRYALDSQADTFGHSVVRVATTFTLGFVWVLLLAYVGGF